MEIIFSKTAIDSLRSSLLIGEVEKSAVVFATQVVQSGGSIRFLVTSLAIAKDEDYVFQSIDRVQLKPEFIAGVTKQAKKDKQSVIFVHTHPGASHPQFSSVDDDCEQTLEEFLKHRLPDNTHASIVISRGGLRARQIGRKNEISVISLGHERIVEFDPEAIPSPIEEVFDRQIRAFGSFGQRKIEKLKVGIVGLGGTGSLIVQQLAHLGVRDFLLIDPDIIESTNLNRVVGATPNDIGEPKVQIAERLIMAINPKARVKNIQGNVVHTQVANGLTEVDFIFGCTDSHGSRAVLQQVSYQYFIPAIDLGTTIIASNGSIEGIFGRTQLLSPGQACLTCSNLLNAEEVRRDMMSAFERKLDPYIQGAHEPAPAVISINSTVSALAITMFLAVITGIPSKARYLIYNGLSSSLRSVFASQQKNCFICSSNGVLARGQSRPLFARQD